MRNFLFFLLIAALMQACSSLSVFSDFDLDSHPEAYGSFGMGAWEYVGDEAYFSSEDKDRMLQTVRKEMLSRKYWESSQPDLWIRIRVVIEEKELSEQPFPFDSKWEDFLGLPYYTRTFCYKEATLLIECIDAQNRKEIWKGIAKRIVEEPDSKWLEKPFNKELKALVKAFPFKANRIRLQPAAPQNHYLESPMSNSNANTSFQP